jgi:hypothetical protein
MDWGLAGARPSDIQSADTVITQQVTLASQGRMDDQLSESSFHRNHKGLGYKKGFDSGVK